MNHSSDRGESSAAIASLPAGVAAAAEAVPEWRRLWPLGLVLLFSAFLRSGVISVPLERDEGEYAYIAQRWLQGDVPYRDAFDQKPPGVFAAYTVLFALGFKSIEAIHWLGQLHVAGAAVFVYLIGRRLFSHVAGLAAALFSVVLVIDLAVRGNASNTEQFAILPLAAGMYFAIEAARGARLGHSVLAGVSGALALCFKQVTLPAVGFYAVWIVVCRWTSRGSGRDRDGAESAGGVPGGGARRSWQALLGGFVLGMGLVIVPVWLYFVARGAWQEFRDCVVTHNISYAGRVPAPVYGMNLYQMSKLLWKAFAGMFGVVIFALYAAWTQREPGMRACLWWWLALFIGVSVGGYYRDHYFILAMPAVALVGGYGAEMLSRVLEPKRAQWQPLVAALVAAAAAGWTLFTHREYFWTQSSEYLCRRLYGPNPFPESIPLASLMRGRSDPSDTVFICGSEPQILFYADRASASRYIFVYPLFRDTDEGRARQREAIDELRRAPPKFIVMVDANVVPRSYSADPGASDEIIQAIADLIESEYRPFAATVLSPNGRSRVLEPIYNEAGEPFYNAHEPELITMHVFERRAAAGPDAAPSGGSSSMQSWRERLQQNLAAVRQTIQRAAEGCGRAADSVRLVAVTKQVDAEVAAELVRLGVRDLGESRPQELWRKHELVTAPTAWHLIGPLQRNKARRTLPMVQWIHSVDSVSLLRRLDELAGELGVRPALLLEVNVSGEPSKHGFAPEALRGAIERAGELTSLELRGLMTMAPYDPDPEQARPTFARLRALRDELAALAAPRATLDQLSMGMSGDYAVAIAEGATMVRVGSALFDGINELA